MKDPIVNFECLKAKENQVTFLETKLQFYEQFLRRFTNLLTFFQAEPEVDERVEGERRDMRLSPPLCSGLSILLVLDPPGIGHFIALQSSCVYTSGEQKP